jgi:hypothetical protein
VAVAEAKGSLGSDTILSITENGYGKMMKKKYERKMNLIDLECNCLQVYISGKCKLSLVMYLSKTKPNQHYLLYYIYLTILSTK